MPFSLNVPELSRGTFRGLIAISLAVLVGCTQAEAEAARRNAPSLEITASPEAVSVNGSATVSWDSRKASVCIASGDWSGIKSKQGSETFTDINTALTFTLTCSNASARITQSVELALTQANTAPLANAGADQNVTVGSSVVLDGSGSFDADGDALNYVWEIGSRPAGSSATLDNPASVNPRFTADVGGVYDVSLRVGDGIVAGTTDWMQVTASGAPPANTAPIANAGADQNVTTGDQVTLDGSGSFDADGDTLNYIWTLESRPTGSSATLNTTSSVSPRFTADVAGDYQVSLRVGDGMVASPSNWMQVTASSAPPTNTAPIADAGADQNVTVGDQVTLDSSGSFDAESDPLNYVWTLESRPAGSSATLDNSSSASPRFSADVEGDYQVSLRVGDGTVASNTDRVQVTASNAPPANTAPIADAGANQNVATGDQVMLNGSGSSDADGDPLTYAWSLDTRPGGSSATLDDATAASPRFTADVDGLYQVSLVVNDGLANSTANILQVTAASAPPVNSAPIANAGANQNVDSGDQVVLNGNGSSDADGDPLTYAWSLVTRPGGSSATLDNATSASPRFTADVDGNYQLSLVVNDGLLNSSSDSLLVTASTPAPVIGYPRELVPMVYACSDSNIHCVDDNAGANQEFSSIQQAVNIAGPGDSVIVHDGSYTGFRVNNGGFAGSEILITGNGNNVNITGPGSNNEGDGIYIANADYVIIEGFNVSGATANGIATHDASANSPMQGVQIRYNTVVASVWVNIYLSNASNSLVLANTSYDSINSHGIYISNAGSDNVEVVGNLIYDNNTAGIHFNGDSSVGGDGVISGAYVDGNTAFGNGQNGLNADGLRSSVFVNNLVYANNNHGIRAYRIDSSLGPADLSFINNTVVNNGGNAIKLTADGGGHLFFNNILMNNGAGCIYVESSNIVSDNNLFNGGCSFSPNNTSLFYGAASQAATLSAVFSDPGSEDYSLLPGSPAIDNGVVNLNSVDAPDADLMALPRDGNPDIGAIEF